MFIINAFILYFYNLLKLFFSKVIYKNYIGRPFVFCNSSYILIHPTSYRFSLFWDESHSVSLFWDESHSVSLFWDESHFFFFVFDRIGSFHWDGEVFTSISLVKTTLFSYCLTVLDVFHLKWRFFWFFSRAVLLKRVYT